MYYIKFKTNFDMTFIIKFDTRSGNSDVGTIISSIYIYAVQVSPEQ